MVDVDVRVNPDERRYEVWSDGELAGIAEFRLAPGRIIFFHTEVEPQFRGKGLAQVLIRYALDDVRADGTRAVVPRCVMVRGWIDRHPDYQDLVATAEAEEHLKA